MSLKFTVENSRHLAIAVACSVALTLGLIVPALATSQAGPLYVYDTADAYAIEGYTTANNGIGVEGYAALASATGVTGVLGYTSSQFSTGVTGYSDGTGTSYGAYGFSANGNGLYGKSNSSSAASIYGFNDKNGTAIYGYSNGLAVYGVSTLTNGVVGTTQTNDGGGTNHYAGVLGTDNSTSGTHYGVAGTTANANGVAILADATGGGTALTARANGSNPGIAVTGSGFGDGVRVNTTAGNGNGVYAQSNQGFGVYGSSNVIGVEGASSGSMGIGVFAQATGSSGIALRVNTGNFGTPITVRSGAAGGVDIMSLDNMGNMILKGALTQGGTPLSVARNPRGTGRVVYAPQQAEPTIEDVGEAQMVGGRAYVPLDPAFAELIDRRALYYVFVTPEADTAGLFVTQRSAAGFVVREHGNVRSTIGFQYRIVARPVSAQRRPRLALYHEPAPDLVHDKADSPDIARPHRATFSPGVTLGKLPQRLKAPFVPKPNHR